LVGLGFALGIVLVKQVLYCLSHTSSPFCSDYFGDGGLINYFSGVALSPDPSTLCLPSARITGMSHWLFKEPPNVFMGLQCFTFPPATFSGFIFSASIF
jgi:hypothetical protein